jgi:hypothetical protein
VDARRRAPRTEVLDDVGDVESIARQADFPQGAVEYLSRRPHEGCALTIFLVARLFTHEDDPRVGRTAPEDGLARVAVEIASLAARRGGAKLGEVGSGGDEQSGASDEAVAFVGARRRSAGRAGSRPTGSCAMRRRRLHEGSASLARTSRLSCTIRHRAS